MGQQKIRLHNPQDDTLSHNPLLLFSEFPLVSCVQKPELHQYKTIHVPNETVTIRGYPPEEYLKNSLYIAQQYDLLVVH